MDKYIKEEISFKVLGENKTNIILNDVTPLILEVFKGLQGEQVFKSGASVTSANLLKKYADKTDIILKECENRHTNEEHNAQVYLNCSEYSVYIKVILRFNKIGKGFLYYENTKYILNTGDLKILNLYDFEPIGEINEEEQLLKVESALKLLHQVQEIKKDLKPYALTELIKDNNAYFIS